MRHGDPLDNERGGVGGGWGPLTQELREVALFPHRARYPDIVPVVISPIANLKNLSSILEQARSGAPLSSYCRPRCRPHRVR